MASGDDVPFAGQESSYAQFRPGYAPDAIDYLADRFAIDETSRVLDLGCGTGQLTIPFARRAARVVGMDPNPVMLDETRRRLQRASLGNVDLVRGSDADLRAGDTPGSGDSQLVVMGRSFHWMQQRETLDYLRDHLDSGGGIAILTGTELLTRCPADWAATVYDTVATYLDDVPDRQTGDVEYDDPWDELLEERGFVDVETRRFDQQVEWDIDRIIGYVYSLSFAPKSAFGSSAAAFESTLRMRLERYEQSTFVQAADTEVISARRPT